MQFFIYKFNISLLCYKTLEISSLFSKRIANKVYNGIINLVNLEPSLQKHSRWFIYWLKGHILMSSANQIQIKFQLSLWCHLSRIYNKTKLKTTIIIICTLIWNRWICLMVFTFRTNLVDRNLSINGYALGSGWEWYSLDFSKFIEDYIAVSERTETISKFVNIYK